MKHRFSLLIIHCTILTLASLLTACEKEIPIDIDDQQPQIVVMPCHESSAPIALSLTYSRPVYSSFYIRSDESYFPPITNATVTLSVNGTPVETATRDSNCYAFSHIPLAGEELAINISVPGHGAVTAELTVPQAPVLSAIDTNCNNSSFNFSFTLTDPAATADYYSIQLRCIDTSIFISLDDNDSIISSDTSFYDTYTYFSCTDYLLVDNTNINIDLTDPTASNTFNGFEMLFTDATINGQSHRITLSEYGIPRFEKDSYDIWEHRRLIIEVTSLTRDEYLYRQSMQAYEDDDILSFFSEPVQIHSNINGGIGIFSVSPKTTIQIYLP